MSGAKSPEQLRQERLQEIAAEMRELQAYTHKDPAKERERQTRLQELKRRQELDSAWQQMLKNKRNPESQ